MDRFVDRPRDAVVADLLLSQHVVRLGRVGGAGCERCAEGIETDGLRWALVLGERATALDELTFFDWMKDVSSPD